MIKIYKNHKWVPVNPTNTIFVISPGAGTFRNRKAYQLLEQYYNVLYIANSGGIYDKYPTHWENNSFVISSGKHLGGIAELVSQKIFNDNIIPCAIIAGSRGGQVTIGKIWERIWKGPTIMVNAGCLTTHTALPSEIPILFIIMEFDYFQSVNRPEKVKELIVKYQENKNMNTNIVYLKNHYHMPNLNTDLVKLFLYCILYTSGNIDKIPLNVEVY